MIVNKVNYNKVVSNKPIKVNLDLMTYDILSRYVLQPAYLVKMEHLVNLRKLISIIDYSTYENDPEKTKRVNFIFKALEARLDNNILDRDIILTYVNGGLSFTIDFLDYNRLDLNKDEVQYIHNLVSEILQYQFIYNKVDDIQDVCTRFKTADFCNRGNIVQDMENLIDDMKSEFRKTKVDDSITDMTFSLQNGVFENCITNTYNIITNVSRRLITGMQGFNEMIGGGFESGRVYMLLGTSGVGKSLTLLNLIYQMKLHNKFYQTKDPTKKPCICLLTMENSVVETITRLFDLVIEGSHGMANYTLEQVIHMLRTQGELVVNDSSPIDIVIKYKANKSVNTSYLYSLYDDLDDQGYEMICLVQDHVKRIRSIYANSDLRLELGDIVNEFKTFAIEKDIPVITNSHLNRDASRILEEQSRKLNQDAGKLLGKSNIGESMLMVDNLDVGLIITLDFDKEENRFMTFNLIKMRDKTNRMYIAQPFVPGSTIRLMADVGGIPQFKESIHSIADVGMRQNTIIKTSGASSMFNNINNVIDINDDDINNNAFANNQTYNFDPNSVNRMSIIKPVEFMPTYNYMSMNIQSLKDQIKKQQAICPVEFE